MIFRQIPILFIDNIFGDGDDEFMPRVTWLGTFAHRWPITLFRPWALLKFLFSGSRNPFPDAETIERELPVHEDEVKSVAGVMWFGHSSVLFNLRNESNEIVSVLADPVFSDRVPEPFGPRRYRPVPRNGIDMLPATLRAVVISHDHYDHLDLPTVDRINKRFGTEITWFCGRGGSIYRLLRSVGCECVRELSWFEEHELLASEIRLTFTPAQHWCGRSPSTFNRSLWGSWVIKTTNHTMFFAGDTGYYQPLFKHIGRRFGPFDLAAIPIGAYEPRDALAVQHVDPDEAVKIHVDIGASRSIAIHWATFSLGREGILQPRKDLQKALHAHGLTPEHFRTLEHGRFYPLDSFQ